MFLTRNIKNVRLVTVRGKSFRLKSVRIVRVLAVTIVTGKEKKLEEFLAISVTETAILKGKTAMNYKLSRYNYQRKLKNGKTLIFNGASNACIVLEKQKMQEFNNLEERTDFSEMLIEQGFWVSAEECEEFRFHAYKQSNLFQDTKARNIVIAPTMKCNARCYYCYEQGREISTMTKEIADQTVNFLVDFAKNSESVNISWFGGEPLLAIDTIDYIMKNVGKKLPENVVLSSSITTNGSLLNDSVIDLMKNSWNMKYVQITLDGCKEYYEKIKDYKNKEDNFSNIIESIKNLIKNDFYVVVRLNIAKDNTWDLIKLIEFIKKEIGTPENFDFVAMSIFDFGNGNDNRILTAKEINRYCAPIFRKMFQEGYWRDGLQSVLRSRALPCAALRSNSFCIDPYGYLYKCQHYLTDKKSNVGNVFDGVIYNKEFCRWCSAKMPSKCNKCKYLPICQGGCKQMGNPCTIIKYIMPALLEMLYLQNGGEKNGSIVESKQ